VSTKVISARATILIVGLQYLAIAVIVCGTLGELAALYALWQQHSSTFISDVVFGCTASLVILLAITLAAPIPGLLRVTRSLELKLEDGESLRWSGACRRFVGGRWVPLRFGKLFLTDKRLVWLNAPAGGYPADDIEVRLGEFQDIRFEELHLPGSRNVFGLRNIIFAHWWHYTITVTSNSGKSYQFFIREKAYDRIGPHLQAFLPNRPAV
jgi:hypothetical protein